jgi:hypothetical protein
MKTETGSFVRVVLHRKDKESIATFVELAHDMPDSIRDTNITVSLGNEVAGSATVRLYLAAAWTLLTLVMIQRVMAKAGSKGEVVKT